MQNQESIPHNGRKQVDYDVDVEIGNKIGMHIDGWNSRRNWIAIIFKDIESIEEPQLFVWIHHRLNLSHHNQAAISKLEH